MGRVFFNTRKNLDTDSLTDTTAYSMTEADSGKTFMVSGGAQAVTLLPAADLVEGWNCSFVNSATPGGSKTLAAATGIIHGPVKDGGDAVGPSTVGTAVQSIVITTASRAGDVCHLFCDGSAYYCHIVSGTNTAYTMTAA